MEKRLLKEDAAHGTVLFPLAYYETQGEVTLEVTLHWHKETELILLKEGVFTFSVNMKHYRVEAPAFVFIGAECIHSIMLDMGKKESAVVFDLQMLSFEHLDAVQYQLLQPLLEGYLKFPLFITHTDACFTSMLGFYEGICREHGRKGAASYLRIKAYLYEVIALLWENHKLEQSSGDREGDEYYVSRVKRVLTYLGENLGKKITVEEAAGVAGMNSQYFCRFFKKMMGKTMTEYVNEIRIEKAARYLCETDWKIIEIAMACGYDSAGYFIRRFEKVKGMTPKQFRESANSSKSQNSDIFDENNGR